MFLRAVGSVVLRAEKWARKLIKLTKAGKCLVLLFGLQFILSPTKINLFVSFGPTVNHAVTPYMSQYADSCLRSNHVSFSQVIQ